MVKWTCSGFLYVGICRQQRPDQPAHRRSMTRAFAARRRNYWILLNFQWSENARGSFYAWAECCECAHLYMFEGVFSRPVYYKEISCINNNLFMPSVQWKEHWQTIKTTFKMHHGKHFKFLYQICCFWPLRSSFDKIHWVSMVHLLTGFISINGFRSFKWIGHRNAKPSNTFLKTPSETIQIKLRYRLF